MHTLFRLWLLLFLALAGGVTSAQTSLLLQHHRKDQHRLFRPGDHIRLQLREQKTRHSGFIEAVTDSVLILQKPIVFHRFGQVVEDTWREFIPLGDIQFIFKDQATAWSTSRNLYYVGATLGGSFAVGALVVNTLIYGAAPPVGALVAITALLSSGLIIKYLGSHRYRIGKRWELSALGNPLPLENHR